MTKLDKPLRREIEIGSRRYTLTIDPAGLQLKRKGHRRGLNIRWSALASEVSEQTARPPLPGPPQR